MKKNWMFESFVIVATAIVIAVAVAGWEASKYIAEPGTRSQGAVALAIAVVAAGVEYVIIRWFANKATR